MAGIDSFFFHPSFFSPSLQAVNPYKGTSAGPVNHTEVLEMNKSSQDKDSTYLLSACCICCEMESGESLPKNKNAEKWEMNLVWECSYVHRLQIPSRAHCSCLGQSYSLCLCPSACFSRSHFFTISLDRNQQKEVNDELLKRITDNKAQPPARNFRVERSSTSMLITYESQPFEVHAWLNAKGFSRPWVTRELWHVTLQMTYGLCNRVVKHMGC